MTKVLIMLGSKSDAKHAKACGEVLASLGIPFRVTVASAHRNPDRVSTIANGAIEGGFKVIIAMAGLSAALPGAVAAHTDLPVIGVPLSGGVMGGLDALLSTSQMPPGIPVASVGVDGAKNAAILAARIIALEDNAVRDRLKEMREESREHTRRANLELAQEGLPTLDESEPHK
ncbi:5-(carboxyamino)imidazole ribonucleotide mutase [Thermanaerovibrio acidaminovorans]|jgi:5-(carboxyamino)imidazole ribonucleotide mutase|uniref:N5-carboxyaminoimidazole ribonucleotide mutase n=1 Tax=Thermanaerovibrio acidaminovorans (strain ATCC 49978 / DSM 6589 / Su883) TaxID=525903 RepID=D1B9N5_THEAS|nr:5-(carboxyamino)imidazole ribonucleotide mutase [Thermanaerovibrio acidaminovorans]ACZ18988.1 phosphoribosylaminoimidazole carboxylase, catalytic subunit [Thermanaerovibrio acidaminovorans DSM 6589]